MNGKEIERNEENEKEKGIYVSLFLSLSLHLSPLLSLSSVTPSPTSPPLSLTQSPSLCHISFESRRPFAARFSIYLLISLSLSLSLPLSPSPSPSLPRNSHPSAILSHHSLEKSPETETNTTSSSRARARSKSSIVTCEDAP
jgi:hypothetical protein